MKEATVYANEIAKEENDDGAGGGEASPARPQVYAPTAEESAGAEEGAGPGAQGDGRPHRQGPDPGGLQGDRLRSRPSSEPCSADARRGPLRRAHSFIRGENQNAESSSITSRSG
ncbi:MAG: hypothetical protein MZV49_05835 [Rhodopseudomonas palustris]|nr:hypothetical protein [Rhodopseudomonas palustris]